MSFPSLNARSAALPPPATPPRNRKKFLSHLSLSRSRFGGSDDDLDLPLQTIPDSPLYQIEAQGSGGAGAQVVATPQDALRQWRRSRSSTVGSARSHGGLASVAHPSSASSASARLSDQYIFRSASSDGSPCKPAGHSRTLSAELLRSPRMLEAPAVPATVPRVAAAPARPPPPLPTLPSGFFSAILLSQKTVHLPPQPFSATAPGTLVQLQVAGSTNIIPLAMIERHPSHLARFATGCTTMEDDMAESDGTFSEIETDRELDPPSPLESESSANLDIPSSPPSPPFHLRVSSMTKLQKLGLLPPRDSSTGFLLDPTTPRPDLTAFAQAAPARPAPPPRRPSRARSTIKFLNVLLLRSPEPYAAVAHFFAHGALLPSLRTISEGETECKGCPLCGDTDRLRRLREVESEAEWLGIEGLARLCRKERLGQDVGSVGGPRAAASSAQRKGEGWI